MLRASPESIDGRDAFLVGKKGGERSRLVRDIDARCMLSHQVVVSRLAFVVLYCIGCSQSSSIGDAGTEAGIEDVSEDLMLAIRASERQSDVVQRICACGFPCGSDTTFSEAEARCFLAQAAGDTELFRAYFRALEEFSRAVTDCYDQMGCVNPSTCALPPPDLVRTPPAFYIRGLGVCL